MRCDARDAKQRLQQEKFFAMCTKKLLTTLQIFIWCACWSVFVIEYKLACVDLNLNIFVNQLYQQVDFHLF